MRTMLCYNVYPDFSTVRITGITAYLLVWGRRVQLNFAPLFKLSDVLLLPSFALE